MEGGQMKCSGKWNFFVPLWLFQHTSTIWGARTHFLWKSVISGDWYLIKASGKTLHHVSISYLTENTFRYFFNSSTILRSCYNWGRMNPFCLNKMRCRLLFNLGLTTKPSGESLLHTFRTSQRTPWASLYLYNYSKNLVPLGAYEPILLKKCDARCCLIAAQKFWHLANPCFTCKYTFCTSQRTLEFLCVSSSILRVLTGCILLMR